MSTHRPATVTARADGPSPVPPFVNPVLPGCHPDPSVCRVGEDYYLVVSSFTLFPAIPIFHSRDLVRWRQIGHVLDRPEQVGLTGLDASDGVWAATIRHHDGVFYVVSTLARGRTGAESFVATASDPAGPWSDPVPLEADGIDPSLFFDHDGTCWYTAARDAQDPAATGPGEIWLRRMDLDTLRLVGPTRVLWHGALGGQWVEAPHLVEHDGRYYLIAAEGGTERNHAVTCAVADTVTGPYRTDPRSPLLTHRHLGPDQPVQNVGHADLVTTPQGQTWALVLGVRPVDGWHTLGRETFLVPVEWTEDGPVFAPGAGLVPAGEAPAGPGPVEPFDPDVPYPAQGWFSLRGPVGHLLDADTARPALRLTARATPLSGTGTPAMIVRRQQHLRFRADCRLQFEPGGPAQHAGVVVLQHQDRYATLGLTCSATGTVEVQLTERRDGVARTISTSPVGTGPVTLTVTGDGSGYQFSITHAGSDDTGTTPAPPTALASIAREHFSTESAGGFLGVHLGVFAVTDEHPAHADLLGWTYQGDPAPVPPAPPVVARPTLPTAVG